MPRRSVLKVPQRCLDSCFLCSFRGHSIPPARNLFRAHTTQFRSSSSTSKPPGPDQVVCPNNGNATPSQPSQPSPASGNGFGGGFGSGFGGGAAGGWSTPSFATEPQLTSEELKQRDMIRQRQAAQPLQAPKAAEKPERTRPQSSLSRITRGSDGHQETSVGRLLSDDPRPDRPFSIKRNWTCPKCGYSVFLSRSLCPKCATPRPVSTPQSTPQSMPQSRPQSQSAPLRIRKTFGDAPPLADQSRTPSEAVKSDWTTNDPTPSPKSSATLQRPQEDTQNLAKQVYELEVEQVVASTDSKPERRRRRGRNNLDEDDAPGRFRQPSRGSLGGLDEDDLEFRRRRKREAKAKERMAPTPLYLPEFISVGNLANALGLHPSEFLRRMTDFGFEDVDYNHVLDAETAGLIATEFNFTPVADHGGDDLVAAPVPEDTSHWPSRPPVVTIMGHVDHGKTTLLDWLRKSSVVASEHGGITQHIGAFSVTMPSGKTITFLDTPGHAAFLDMRRRGADVTDIVILVVAADDSVKPQTIEAIKHAKESNVPIIVAINKVDKEGVNIEKVKQDLSRHNVYVEDFGGDVQTVCVSGKTGQGMRELEEAALTLSEMLDHRAPSDGNAEGWVIEATTKKGGRAATVLVKRGTLRQGDVVVAGTTWARVRTLKDEAGVVVNEAPPGTPVEVDGWKEQPQAGSEVLQASSEQQAKEVVELRLEKLETRKLGQDVEAINETRKAEIEKKRRETATDEDGAVEENDTDTSGPRGVPFIVKADVSGSVEAVVNSISAIGNNEVYARILQSGVGQIGESDIEYAAAAGSHIVTFNTHVEPGMSRMAEMSGVKIMKHNIIYELIDDVKAKLSEYLPPTVSQHVTGEAEIGQIFTITVKSRVTTSIAGCKVRNGVINKGHKVRVLRNKGIIHDGTITSLKNVKKDVTEMRKGTECGIGFLDWTDFQVGDHIQCYEELSEKRYL
ncbi:translation initiation factor IF-2 [Polytolypa hystricis UAMH7299]|uniref:Translation initiation factor IF-2, mitochondrial n=1 Tax=Polytolypa hystricis (strain UAMH7299) TaxID=1447883 RepID=A0A2B7Z2E3_POLH7|nr:translation initiation factor IF-2 [Polytolypa hystricis UAMH7299]